MIVTERLDLKNLLHIQGVKYKELCNVIEKRIGWLTSRLNGYVRSSSNDDIMILEGIEKLSAGKGLSWEAVDDG